MAIVAQQPQATPNPPALSPHPPTILEQKYRAFPDRILAKLLLTIDTWTLIRVGMPPSHLRRVLQLRLERELAAEGRTR